MPQVQIRHYIFDTGSVLGKGSTGTVFKGADTRNNRVVAVKVIELKSITNEVTKYLLDNEIKALQLTSHPNVLHAYDVITDQQCCYVVTNYCCNDTLDRFIKARGRVQEHEALKIFKEVVEGYVNIFNKSILHRDLKPSNILFSEEWQPVICDFGYCEISGYLPKPNLKYNVGSPAYMAPESITNNMYSQGSEVWSLGTILYEMLQGRSFAHGKDVMEAIMLTRKNGPYYPEGVSEFSRKIIRECMALKPNERMRLKDLVGMLRGYFGEQPPKVAVQNIPQTAQNNPSTVQPPPPQPHHSQNVNNSRSSQQSHLSKQNHIEQAQLEYFQKQPISGHVRRVVRTNQPLNNVLLPRNTLPPSIPIDTRARVASQEISQEQILRQPPTQRIITMPSEQLVVRTQPQTRVSNRTIQEERPPSNSSRQSFRPTSSNLGIHEHNFDNSQLIESMEIPPPSAGDASLLGPDEFPEYRYNRADQSFRSQPVNYTTRESVQQDRRQQEWIYHQRREQERRQQEWNQQSMRSDQSNSRDFTKMGYPVARSPQGQTIQSINLNLYSQYPSEIQNQLAVNQMNQVMLSKRSNTSQTPQNQVLNSLALQQQSTGSPSIVPVQYQQMPYNPFQKNPNAKVYYSHQGPDGLQDIRKLQKVRLTHQAPSNVLNSQKRKPVAMLESIQLQPGTANQRDRYSSNAQFVQQTPSTQLHLPLGMTGGSRTPQRPLMLMSDRRPLQ